MKEIFDQFLQFLQQGIAAIFRFVQLVWTWSMDQISRMAQAPLESWPIWKQVLLVVVVAIVAYFLFIAARQLWFAGMHVLTAFASFLGALIVTLPSILLAGAIALAGLWVINNFQPPDLSNVTLFERSNTASSSSASDGSSRQTTGQAGTRQ